METFLVVGLGNPDKKYEGTRHNAGFMAIDSLAELLGVRVGEKRFNGLCGDTVRDGKKLYLLKPQTYMNNSGLAVRPAADYYNIPLDHIIVLVDDINFKCGKMRIRGSGSAGGHNGLKSIIAQMGSDGFARIRIGVGGLKQDEDMISHVLGGFSKADKETMEKEYRLAAEAVLSYIDDGLNNAMNKYNGMDIAPEPVEDTDNV